MLAVIILQKTKNKKKIKNAFDCYYKTIRHGLLHVAIHKKPH